MSSCDERGEGMPPDLPREILPASAAVTDTGLKIAGCDLAALAHEYGTPLYVYDEATLRQAAATAVAAFQVARGRVSFAAKACSLRGVLSIFAEEGLGLDAVSGGEVEAGLRSGFPPERIHLHGNYKTDQELEAAVTLGLHAVVLDNVEEVRRLEAIAARTGKSVRVVLRIVLPLEAETHPHLQTSGWRSKFGFFRGSSEEDEALRMLAATDTLCLAGLHTHLGSQIADLGLYQRAAQGMVAIARDLRGRFPIQEVSLGGGWAVAYVPGAPSITAAEVARAVAGTFDRSSDLRLAVEPGRALVARAAVALYRAGSVKRFDGHRVVAVDGGMGDNPRPALYGARYTALVAARPLEEAVGPTDIAGRYCESGDVLVRDAPLPAVAPGDLICVPMAGAYQLSMASGYNLVPPPAAVMLSNGKARLIGRRATVEDLLVREV